MTENGDEQEMKLIPDMTQQDGKSIYILENK
jgi:hypothetical protein